MDQPPEDPGIFVTLFRNVICKMFSNSSVQTDLNESKKKDEKNAKKRLQRLGEPNRGSNLRQQSNLSFFKPKASPRSKTHKPNSSSCGQMASNHLLASSSQQRNEQDDFPPADVEAAGHPAAAPLEGLDSFQNVTNQTETTVDVDEMSKCGNQLPYLMHFIFYYYLFQGQK